MTGGDDLQLPAAPAVAAVAGATAADEVVVAEATAAAVAAVLPNTEATSQGKTPGDSPKFKGHGLTN